MALMDCEEQLGALAESVKGEETVAPLPGVLTVTPAKAGAAMASRRSRKREAARIMEQDLCVSSDPPKRDVPETRGGSLHGVAVVKEPETFCCGGRV